MSQLTRLTPQFVEYIPHDIQDGVLYISEEYGTASHNCACGCGVRVVTPLTAVEWRIVKDGQLISLFPSIGNHDYPCRSHYWIKRNQIVWAPQWSRDRVELERLKDRERKEAYFARATPARRKAWLKSTWSSLRRWLAHTRS